MANEEWWRRHVVDEAKALTAEDLDRIWKQLSQEGVRFGGVYQDTPLPEPRDERPEDERSTVRYAQGSDDPRAEYSYNEERIVRIRGVWGLFTPFDEDELEELGLTPPQPPSYRGPDGRRLF